MAVMGTISGGIFDYLVANDLSFAINLIKFKNFLDGIDHKNPLEAVLNEDRGYFTLSSGPIMRELRYLPPETVDMAIVNFPDRYSFFWTAQANKMDVISRGLEQVGPRSTIHLKKKKIGFISKDGGNRFTYSDDLAAMTDEEIKIDITTKHLATISEHLSHDSICRLFIQENSPVLVENILGPKINVMYLIAHLQME